jgi:hypothetical protein
MPRLLACAESLGTQYKRPEATFEFWGTRRRIHYITVRFLSLSDCGRRALSQYSLGKTSPDTCKENPNKLLSLRHISVSAEVYPSFGFTFFHPENPETHRLPFTVVIMSTQNNQHDTAAPRTSDAQPNITNATTTLPSGPSTDDTLLCKWKQCGERADSAESLFVSPIVVLQLTYKAHHYDL